MDSDSHKHFLKPEQEVRNYFLTLNLLEEELKAKEPFSKKLLLEVQIENLIIDLCKFSMALLTFDFFLCII